MYSIRLFLFAALLAVLATSCQKNDPVPQGPQVDLSKQYSAAELHSEAIHIGVRGKWHIWSQDSVLIKNYMSRRIQEENNPGFLPPRKSQSLGGAAQRLSFENQLALLMENGQTTTYSFEIPNGYTVLWLRQQDTLTYYENERPAVVSKLGYFTPVYYQKTPAPENPDYKYQIRTVPERYFTIETGELQAPGILYHLRKWDEVEDFGEVHNYLGYQPDILQGLEVGDTLLIQLYRKDFTY
ncbi:hypothetical protein [Cesiribacter andamanensis]|uniref:Uncharacterized protein n=1 Tax=Cesiribacter andamanensis AMV16 TaxID=1279009 RepID=M7P166_9BACT|nr:hypothetical protein [Cesiribacter andamanensis]EMR04329.1 hypothetical protein ADICEAN_00492 [Cesiribacter andamanensis AMV16]